MIKWNKNYTFSLVGILIFSTLLYIGLYFIVVKPLQREVEQHDQQIKMYENVAERMAEQSSEIGDEEELVSVLNQIPKGKEPDELLRSLSDLSSTSNVTITNIESVEAVESSIESIYQASYTIEIIADSLNRVDDFLYGLLQGERFVTVNTLEIGQGVEDVTAIMNVTTFYTNE